MVGKTITNFLRRKKEYVSETVSVVEKPMITVTPTEQSPEEINRLFKEICEDMRMNESAIESAMNQPLNMKIAAIQNRKCSTGIRTRSASSPASPSLSSNEDEEDDYVNYAEIIIEDLLLSSKPLSILNKVQVMLRTGAIEWVDSFINLEGVAALNHVFSKTDFVSDVEVQLGCLQCYKAIFNTRMGVETFLSDRESVRTLALNLQSSSPMVRSQIIFLLALLCSWSAQGYKLVLDAFNYYKLVRGEDYRFQDLIRSFSEIEDIDYRLNTITLFNSLLIASPDDAVHIKLQREFKKNGLYDIIKSLIVKYVPMATREECYSPDSSSTDFSHTARTPQADSELEFLTCQLFDFEQEMGEGFPYLNLKDFEDPCAVTQVLSDNLLSEEYDSFKSILYDLLLYTVKSQDLSAYKIDKGWKTIEKIIYRITQEKESESLEHMSERMAELNDRVNIQEKQIHKLKREIASRKRNYYKEVHNAIDDLEKQGTIKMKQPKQALSSKELLDLDMEMCDMLLNLARFGLKHEESILYDSNIGNEPLPNDPDSLKQYYHRAKEMFRQKIAQLEQHERVLKAEKDIYMEKLQKVKGHLSPIQDLVDDILKQDQSLPTLSTGMPSIPPPPPGMNGPGMPPPPPDMGPPPPPLPPGMGPPPPPLPPGMGPPPPPPPLPGMGPPPPPGFGPPMMGGMNNYSFLPKLPDIKPKGPTRQIHFDQIPKKDLQQSIFFKNDIMKVSIDLMQELDTEEMEAMFSTKRPVKEDSEAQQAEKSQKKQVVSLLDGKRAYSVALQLGSLRNLTYQKIREAIISLDETVINDSNISIIKQIVPAQDEIDLVASYDGDCDLLAEPEKFFKVMHGVPNLPERMEAWTFKMKFLGLVSNIRPDLENIYESCKEVKSSKKFADMLALVLTIGNFLNGQNQRKISYGFKVKSLLQLSDTKTSDGKSHLLAYLVRLVYSKYPELENFEEELEHVKASTRVVLAAVIDDINELKKGLTQVEKQLNIQNDLKEDRFQSVMTEFHENAKNLMEKIDEQLNKVNKILEEIATLFNEDKKTLLQNPGDWFRLIQTFIDTYKAERIRYLERLAEEERKLARAAEAAAKEAAKESKTLMEIVKTTKSSRRNAMKGDERKEMEERAQRLRSGELWKIRRKKRNSLAVGGEAESMQEQLSKMLKQEVLLEEIEKVDTKNTKQKSKR